jgi:hypothetical protein
LNVEQNLHETNDELAKHLLGFLFVIGSAGATDAYARLDADARLYEFGQRCNGSGNDQLAIACQSSVFRCHLNSVVARRRMS